MYIEREVTSLTKRQRTKKKKKKKEKRAFINFLYEIISCVDSCIINSLKETDSDFTQESLIAIH